MNQNQVSSGADRLLTGVVVWLFTWLGTKGYLTTSQAAEFMPLALAVLAALYGIYKNRLGGYLAQIGNLPPAAVAQAVLNAPGPEGKVAILDAATGGAIPAAQVAQAVIQMPEIKGIVATASVANDPQAPSTLVVSSPSQLPPGIAQAIRGTG